jgi:hypothetical protein
MRMSRITPAITPITIPAIAPELNPRELDSVIGIELPEAETGVPKGWVVVAETVLVAVEAIPLVGRKGAEYEGVDEAT